MVIFHIKLLVYQRVTYQIQLAMDDGRTTNPIISDS